MSSSETPAITVDEDGLADPNFDGYFSDKEYPPYNAEDPYIYAPYLPQNEQEVKSAVEDLTKKLRREGMARRQQFNRSLKEFPDQWKALRQPASMNASQPSLAEMLTCVPPVDRDQFQESGDGYVNIPLYILEKYMLLSLRIQGYMHDKNTEALPGGADALMAYSFFSRGSVMPKFRTEHDLEVLRNMVFSAEHFIVQQMQADNEVIEGLSADLKATLRRLKKETTLPDYDHMSNMNQDQIDERQANIDALINLYTNQVKRDYNMFRLQKEQLVLLSHLTQCQSIELPI
jgi:hypothetical protein